jgi:uncharacterized protein YegJ (DUF2314 family)
MRRLIRVLSDDLLWYTYGAILCGLYFAVRGFRENHDYLLVCGVVSLMGGTGLLFRRSWGKWIVAASFPLLGGYAVMALTAQDKNLLAAMLAVLVLGGAWVAANLNVASDGEYPDDPQPNPSDEEEPIISLVALLTEPAFLESPILAKAASDAWGIEVGTSDDDDEDAFVVGESPHFLIKYDDRFLAVHNVDDPYFDETDDVVDETSELRIRHAILEHRAWVSVDLIHGDGDGDHQESYRLIGRLLAQLIDDDCLAVCSAEMQSIHPYHEELIDQLTSDDPLGTLRDANYPPVLSVDEDDPRMHAAVKEARRRWPEFIEAFEQRANDQTFSVKAPVTDGENTEFMWVNVTAVENDIIYGTLGNDPINLRGHKLDDRIRVPLANLNDWMYLAGDELIGGFTLEVFKALAAERKRDDRDR